MRLLRRCAPRNNKFVLRRNTNILSQHMGNTFDSGYGYTNSLYWVDIKEKY